jgi:hypothetical protein
MAALALALLAVTAAALLCPPAAAELPRLEHASAKNDGSLSILVVGDWGRKGTYNQSRVAEQVTFPHLVDRIRSSNMLVRAGDGSLSGGTDEE